MTTMYVRAKAESRAWRQALVFVAVFATSACGDGSEEVGEFKNDWLGNEIKVDALKDPDIPGIICHFTHFDRGVWDRLGKGNWFEDPSNALISCLRRGNVDLSEVSLNKSGEEVFSQRQSMFFKTPRFGVLSILTTAPCSMWSTCASW